MCQSKSKEGVLWDPGVIWASTVFTKSSRKETLILEKKEQLISTYGDILVCNYIKVVYMGIK